MCEVFVRQDYRRYQPETRKIRLNGQSTSIRLEHAFWTILDALSLDQGMSTPQFLSMLHSEILELRGEPVNFTSLLRCVCLVHLEKRSAGISHFRQSLSQLTGHA